MTRKRRSSSLAYRTLEAQAPVEPWWRIKANVDPGPVEAIVWAAITGSGTKRVRHGNIVVGRQQRSYKQLQAGDCGC